MQRMSKLYESSSDAQAQLRRLNEAGITDCWLQPEATLWRVTWYV
jgi:hypothetical protein